MEQPLALVKGFSMCSTRFAGKNVVNIDIEREYISPRRNDSED
jgi:fructose-specific component phosphotransferase system IIB-like protein